MLALTWSPCLPECDPSTPIPVDFLSYVCVWVCVCVCCVSAQLVPGPGLSLHHKYVPTKCPARLLWVPFAQDFPQLEKAQLQQVGSSKISGLDLSNLAMLKEWYVAAILHAIIIFNSFFLLKGIKFYNEDTGVE